MTDSHLRTSRQLRSLVTREGTLRLSLAAVQVPEPGPDEVVVRIEAAPLNPSDLGPFLAGADLSTAEESGPADDPVLTASIPAERMTALGDRVGNSMPAGYEGAGTVVDAGSSDASQALLGRVVAVEGGAMYSQFRCLNASQCFALPPNTRPAEGASSFINPLTALGMITTMRREGHTALVNTAAASSLGQMLVKLCAAEQIPLVNIVRKPEQEAILRQLGAQYVCDTSEATFMHDLTTALAATSATLAFDATGGGPLPGQILSAMEAAQTAAAKADGSTAHKQLYIYAGLEPGPTVLERTFGMAWGVGGWLLYAFLDKIGPDEAAGLRQRVATELTTTFASSYAGELSLAEVLSVDAISKYGRRATGAKFLINPTR